MNIRMPITLSLYIGRQYLVSVLLVLAALMCIAGLLDTVELIRRGASKENLPFSVILEMALFKWPSMGERLMPFAGLIGGMVALSRLTKTHELIVARAAGVSVWQFMLPALLAMVLLGTLFATAFNPIASTMLARYEKLESKYIAGRSSLLAVSPSGLWLRQLEEEKVSDVGEHIIHALKVSDQGMRLFHVTIFSFDPQNRFVERIDADEATLESGYWRVQNALITQPGEPARRVGVHVLETDLTVAQIQDSFASPRTLSFWQLPGFINALESAGFSALRHKLHWHVILSTPIMLCGMAFVAAAFSLRLPRRGGARLLVVAGVFTGFLFFFVSDIIYALGLSGSLPAQVAAWIPIGIIMLGGGATLLHLEDG